ncbi:outer membrane protein assembly factor BamB family protein [Rhabdothermincola sediminis]|uniref:outer membrane protein assembly factor BamB family protein n=1 Tax=Rhabdothermincola sediminis TaxID=2751370 RepID=UPI001AA093DD|nr:PQQ-binding-like beta-propeller repeat protein [Rhabdothermincola sediminis]
MTDREPGYRGGPVRLADLGLTPPTRRSPERGRPWLVPVIILAALVAAWGVVAVVDSGGGGDQDLAARPSGDATEAGDDPSPASTEPTLAPLPPFDGWVNPASSGRPWSETVPGILTFRGNPTRSFYGVGPVPTNPVVLWSFPAEGGMCGTSTDGSGTQTWCGTGWTGQPSVWEHRDGRTWVAFGGYDYAVHWLDYESGARLLPDFRTGDIIKGSVTVDPDGYPLLYTGSRDNYYRIIAMDREQPVELWKIHAKAVSPTLWNDDWDGSGLIIDDYLFEGGENSQFHIVKLNRGYGPDGKVTVDPKLVFNTPGWDSQLLSDLGDNQVSIENSVAISGNTVYFANSGGLVQGWDISGLKNGERPARVFRYWTGDDVDASIVVDAEGFLYVGAEFERGNARAREVGQILKLDPRKPDDPLVWSVKDQKPGKSGVWGTPAIWKDMVYVPTNAGELLGIDRVTGQVVWRKDLGSQTWQSPVVVDDVLIEGDCDGNLHAYDVRDTRRDPPELWSVKLDGCIESTPAVWKGRIFVGARGGKFYAIGDPPADRRSPATEAAAGRSDR